MYGWIIKGNAFKETGMYNHFSSKNDWIEDIVGDKWSDMQNELKGAADQCNELIEADEHPEWHTYEMLKDDLQFELYELMLDKGCVRVGTRYGSKEIHFEARPEVLKSKHQFLVEFADTERMNPNFDPKEKRN